jgi:hypothetical protein
MAIPELEMARVTKRLDAYCDRMSSHSGGAGRYSWRARGNHVCVSEQRPDWSGLPGETTVQELARFHYDPATDGWTLSRRDGRRRLHAYEGSEGIHSFEELADLLEAEPVPGDSVG